MIEELRIRDLGVIADTTLELGPGFTVITGETGAGKTMVVTALGLLMGSRADSSAVRNSASSARVSCVIRNVSEEVTDLVTAAGGETEDGDLTLTRTVNTDGRSRASVGGSSAPVGTLGKLATHLFAVHGQNDQLRLRSGVEQRNMLDRFGGDQLLNVLFQYQEVHLAVTSLAHEVATLRANRDERITEAARLRRELDEIAAVDPVPGEDEELKLSIDRLSNIEGLRVASAEALNALVAADDSPFAADASSLLEQAVQSLERVSAADPRLGDAAEQIRSAAAQINDVSRVLMSYDSDLDNEGPADLSRAHDRLAQINELLRHYGETLGDVLQHSSKSVARLVELEGDDDRIENYEAKLAGLRKTEAELAEQLSAARRTGAARLSDLVTAELQQLALPDAKFLVEVSPVDLSISGSDAVQLLLQPHPGAPPRPVAKSASGGELSRIMLALEVVVASVDPVPTFVFDEVDAGIGGAAAIEIGRRLAVLARTSQVIVVTHLAQVAAFATNHLNVVKDSSGGFTESSCKVLVGNEREAEIARLLSGLSDSDNALAHARELLVAAGSVAK